MNLVLNLRTNIYIKFNRESNGKECWFIESGWGPKRSGGPCTAMSGSAWFPILLSFDASWRILTKGSYRNQGIDSIKFSKLVIVVFCYKKWYCNGKSCFNYKLVNIYWLINFSGCLKNDSLFIYDVGSYHHEMTLRPTIGKNSIKCFTFVIAIVAEKLIFLSKQFLNYKIENKYWIWQISRESYRGGSHNKGFPANEVS